MTWQVSMLLIATIGFVTLIILEVIGKQFEKQLDLGTIKAEHVERSNVLENKLELMEARVAKLETAIIQINNRLRG